MRKGWKSPERPVTPEVRILTGTITGKPGKWEVAVYVGDETKIHVGGGYVIGYAKRVE